jgi:hypothetical protein
MNLEVVRDNLVSYFMIEIKVFSCNNFPKFPFEWFPKEGEMEESDVGYFCFMRTQSSQSFIVVIAFIFIFLLTFLFVKIALIFLFILIFLQITNLYYVGSFSNHLLLSKVAKSVMMYGGKM